MARVNFVGFETGGFEELASVSGSGFIHNALARTGLWSFQCNPTTSATGEGVIKAYSATGVHNTSLNLATVYVRFYLNVATRPASASEEFCAVTATNDSTHKAQLRIDSTGKISMYDGTNLIATGTTVLNNDTWYRIEWQLGSGAGAAYTVRIDGAIEFSGTFNPTNSGNANSFKIGKVVNRNSQTVVFIYDDIAIDNSEFPGAGQVVSRLPDANGTYTAWAAGTGSGGFGELDETDIDDDTTYVTTSTNNDRESCNHFSMDVGADLKSVKLVVTARRSTGNATNYRIGLKSGATEDYTTAADNVDTNYATRAKLYNTDPNTSSAWTVTNFNAAESIIQHQQSQTRALRCTHMALMVDEATHTVQGASSAALAITPGFKSSLSALSRSALSVTVQCSGVGIRVKGSGAAASVLVQLATLGRLVASGNVSRVLVVTCSGLASLVHAAQLAPGTIVILLDVNANVFLAPPITKIIELNSEMRQLVENGLVLIQLVEETLSVP